MFFFLLIIFFSSQCKKGGEWSNAERSCCLQGALYIPLSSLGVSVFPWRCESGRGYHQSLMCDLFSLPSQSYPGTSSSPGSRNPSPQVWGGIRVTMETDGAIAVTTGNAGRDESGSGHMITGTNIRAEHDPRTLATAGELPVSHGLCGQRGF